MVPGMFEMTPLVHSKLGQFRESAMFCISQSLRLDVARDQDGFRLSPASGHSQSLRLDVARDQDGFRLSPASGHIGPERSVVICIVINV